MAPNIGRKIEDYASKNLRELKQQEAKTGKKFTKYDIAIFMIQNGQLNKTEFASWMNTREGFDAQTMSKQQEQALKRGSVFGFAGYGGGEESYLDSLIPFSEKSDIEKFNIINSPNKGLKFGATKEERAKRDKEIKTEIKQQKVKQQILNPKKAAEEKKLIHHLDSLPEVKKEYDEIMAEIKAQDEASMSHEERKKFIMSKFLKAWDKGEKLEMMSALEEFNSYMCSYIDDKLGITDAKESIKEKVHLKEAVEAINKYVDDGNDETITFAEGAWEFMKGLGDAADSLIGAQGAEMAGVFGAAGKAIQASGKFAPVLGGLMKTYFGAEASKLLGESGAKMLGAEKKEDFREAGTDAAFGVMMAHGTVSGLGGIKGSKAAEIANKKALADARKTLGLAENVEITPELLKQAYKSASLKNHPDKGGSTEAFQKVQDAYEVLKSSIEPAKAAERVNEGVKTEAAKEGSVTASYTQKFTSAFKSVRSRFYTTSAEKRAQAAKTVSREITAIKPAVEKLDIQTYAKTGIPLKYSKKDFAQKIKDLVNHLPIEKQNEILKKFNIKLIYTSDETFEISKIPVIPEGKIKGNLEKAVAAEIKRFTQENEFQIENPELKAFLDDFTKHVPEFLFTVGKKQHETHEYTLDVHTLSVLKKASENPEYAKLSDEDKLVLNMAIMLHDLQKEYVDDKTPDNYHASSSYESSIEILDRFDFPDDIKQRISKLVLHHEFFRFYNNAYSKYRHKIMQNEEYAGYGWSVSEPKEELAYLNNEVNHIVQAIKNSKDFSLLKILTCADIESVNNQTYETCYEWKRYEEHENHGFHQKVTYTESEKEFQDYMNDAFSYVDKELQKHDGKIDEDYVWPTTLRTRSKELFGDEETLENCFSTRTYSSSGVNKSTLDYIAAKVEQMRQAGFKTNEIRNKLQELTIKDRNTNAIDIEESDRRINYYIENRDIIEKNDIKVDEFHAGTFEKLNNEVETIKQKEALDKIFKKYKLEERDANSLKYYLFTFDVNRIKHFNQDAFNAMIKLLDTKKYSVEEIQDIIFNSYIESGQRFSIHLGNRDGDKFDTKIFNTILELAETEGVDNACRDIKCCLANTSPESGWTVVPEMLETVKELNKLGVKYKPYLFKIEYEGGEENRFSRDYRISSITRDEAAYKRAVKYAKQGFDGALLNELVTIHEIVDGKVIYNDEVTQMVANLRKRGACGYGTDWIYRAIWDENLETRKFNKENYDFINKMLDMGISVEELNEFVYHSSCSTYYAERYAPDKILETAKISKAKIEGLTRVRQAVGRKIDAHVADAFLDYNVPQDVMRQIDNAMRGVPEYITPFAYINETKLNQTVKYLKRGISQSAVKYLTGDENLFNELKKEKDLSFIQNPNDAALVAKFWNLKDIKSIEELSKTERQQLISDLMQNKVLIEGNHVSDKIPILPNTSEGYANLMNELSKSFGLDKAPYTEAQTAEITGAAKELASALKNTDFGNTSEIENMKQKLIALIPEINNANLGQSIEALQKIVKNPEFEKLPDKGKELMILAALLHRADITTDKASDSAIDAYVIAKRMGYSDVDAKRVYTIVNNSRLIDELSGTKRKALINNDRSYISIQTDEIKQRFDVAAFELKDYDNFKMAKLLYSTYDNNVSLDLIKDYTPDLYKEIQDIAAREGKSENQVLNEIKTNPKYKNQIESAKIAGMGKYGVMRKVDKMLQKRIDEIKSTDVVLPQTKLHDFIRSQTPEWIAAHKKMVNGRNVIVVSSDEIKDFYALAHTTQAYGILGRADVTTNLSNFDAFALFCDNKTVCCSYVGNGKIAVVGPVGVLVLADNTSQYIARGTDISSVAKNTTIMVNEYVSERSNIVQIDHYQSKETKRFDRAYFASMIKEELQTGYRELLAKKLDLQTQIETAEKGTDTSDLQKELDEINKQMAPVDKIYADKLDRLIKLAAGREIDIDFIRKNDPELGEAYDRVLSYINTEHRGDDGLMRTEYHNEVLASNLKLQGLYVTDEKYLMNLTDDYLSKAEKDDLPVVIIK